MVHDKERSSFRSFVHQRLALLQEQLLACREKANKLRYEGGDEEQLAVLAKREAVLLSKISTQEQQDVGEERYGQVHPIFVCNECADDIAYGDGSSPRFHCTECTDFDLCQACYHEAGHCHPCFEEVSDTATIQKKILAAKHIPLMIHAAFKLYANRPCLGETCASRNYVWQWLSYSEIYQRCCVFLNGLLGAVPHCTSIGLAGSNSIDWIVADLACLIAGVVVVPIHTDLRGSSIQHISLNGQLSAAVVDSSLRQKFKQFLECPVFVFGELRGNNAPITPNADASGETLVSLIHTSGSTGLPKGAQMTDRVWSRLLIEGVDLTDPLVCASKDSLAHISDREGVHSTFCRGGRIGMIALIQHLMPSLLTLQPTTVSSTPRFWDALRQKYEKEVFAGALEDALKIQYRFIFGSRLQWITLGGASCSFVTKQWLLRIWGKDVISDGYACTEAGQLADGEGRIYRKVQWKLRPVPMLGYDATTKPRRGEFLCKSPYTINGYVSKDETDKGFDEGFFCTGDVVEIFDEQGNGKLRIIDRAKNYFKLSQGVFVAPTQLENVYLGCNVVEQILILHADLKYNQTSVSAIVRSVEEVADVTAALHKEATKNNLRAFERPAVVIVTQDEWSISNGLMTASNKPNRFPLISKYRKMLNERWEQKNRIIRESQVDDQGPIDIIARALNVSVPNVLHDLTLKEQGADSLAVLHCAQQLNMPFSSVAQSSIAVLLTGQFNLPSVEATEQTLLNDLSWKCEVDPILGQTQQIRKVLLTGSAGFFGQRLLDMLLEETEWDVVVLVHCSTPKISSHYNSRVTLVRGNICSHQLGLQHDYGVDTVIHCAAYVNHLESYSVHRAPNVKGTQRIIQFSRTGLLKRLYFAGSISTLGMSAQEALHQGGYVSSKWVAERLVTQLVDQTVGVFRLGMLSWDERGRNRRDWLCRLIDGCHSLKCAPHSSNVIDIIPRDAACLTCLSLMLSDKSGVWNVVNADCCVSFNDIFSWFDIPLVSFAEWQVQCRSHKKLALFVDGLPDDSDEDISASAFEGVLITKEYCGLYVFE